MRRKWVGPGIVQKRVEEEGQELSLVEDEEEKGGGGGVGGWSAL